MLNLEADFTCEVDPAGLLAFSMPTAAVPLTCPTCGSVLSRDLPAQTYRCALAHAFSSEQLATATQQTLTRTLWSCLRLLEERQWLLTQQPAYGTPDGEQAAILQEVMQQLRLWLGKE